MIRRPVSTRRSGATTVEAAVVMSVFLLFLFGIFEYCRYLMMIEVTTNAARDGARYAVVNVNKGSTFDSTDYSATYPSIKKYVNTRMAGVNSMIDSYTVTVFPCDDAMLALTPPQAVAKSGATWNEAQFGERIAVKITGNYRTVLPSFLLMSATIPVNVVVTMGSEG
ncbi:TadE family protein [Limnoglobus roseus]|uniref:Pilus assembly protein n=1 Tax=Limnoglobus roseus TaxID=2598579 RepID=A0A5C1A4G9_9BACT|nr:TadE/TadG family type IV pilus assembly protein [Limnoglobus roseus]QEL13989.1 pilus assembly protein [Limnoglobus roseus]